MSHASFFAHLNDIPPVLRWLQWLCPLKYTLEALSVNRDRLWDDDRGFARGRPGQRLRFAHHADGELTRF